MGDKSPKAKNKDKKQHDAQKGKDKAAANAKQAPSTNAK
jgi:hypothetical protein